MTGGSYARKVGGGGSRVSARGRKLELGLDRRGAGSVEDLVLDAHRRRPDPHHGRAGHRDRPAGKGLRERTHRDRHAAEPLVRIGGRGQDIPGDLSRAAALGARRDGGTAGGR